ncbi:MAG: 5'-nucleotidase C-terminal domain-containing protein, partial [Gemmatimonadaceae bacterium]
IPLLDALAARTDVEAVRLYHLHTAGTASFVDPSVADRLRSVSFFVGPEVRKAVADVRRAGADAVVVAVHSGLDEPSSYDTVSTGMPSENVSARLAREIEGIDLIVYGHSHKESAGKTIGSTLMLQPKNWAASVGIAHLRVVRGADGRARVDLPASRTELVRAAGHAEHPAVLAATEKAHRATRAWVTTPVGSTPVAWRADSARVADTPIIDLINDVERRVTGAQLASSAAFSTEASLGPGPITVAQLARLYPYDNTLRAIRITGRQLREYLDHSSRYYRTWPSDQVLDPSVPGYNFDVVSGADYTIDLSKPLGSRVTRLEVNGRPVADTDTFTMALNNYRQTGGGGFAMLQGAPVVYESQLEIRQFVIDEVKRRGTVRPEDVFVRNWEIVPAEARSAAYAAQNRGTGPGTRAGSAGAQGRFVRVLAINDFHGAIEARPDSRGVRRGGVAQMAAVIARLAGECRPQCIPVLLAGGDLFQGTPPSNLSYGQPVVAMMHAMGLAASALGNHEFDWGRDTLRARMRESRFTFLAANVVDSLGRDVPWIPNDTLLVREGVRIGVVGVATPETATDTKPENITGLRFAAPAPVVSERARALRARGADVVVLVAHEGGFCDRTGAADCKGAVFDLARAVSKDVDAIVAGHTHVLVNTMVDGIPVVMARSRGQSVGVIDIPLGGGARSAPRVVDVLADSVAPDTAVARLAEAAIARVAPIVGRPVTTVAELLDKDEPPLWNLIADAQRSTAKADVALMNEGGVRADLRAGPATFGDLYEIQPFGNKVVVLTVPGAALRRYFERVAPADTALPKLGLSGARVTWRPGAAEGSRVRSILVGGRPLRDAATYRVALNDFMIGTGAGLELARAATVTRTLGADIDALEAYLRAAPKPVRAPTDARWIAAR